ncbi:NTF2-related export protein 2 [Orchesella cincta]|uniref:NTF2-related export protein 2 n=1 Tax=Orchesella cincta TaxID=48709 RepID=A0A1D2MQB0_ORCCI|nr:NTF2-related export protein 2 [Orchesella cincta]
MSMNYYGYEGNPMMQLPIDAQVVPRLTKKDQDEAQEVAQQFCKTYYETVQKKPHLVAQLYLQTPVLIWDGNPILSREQIQQFFEQLPSLTFNLMTMDAHPANPLAVGPRKTYIIKTAGLYRVSGPGSQKQFSQDIVLTAEGSNWRIASDTFRTIE